MSFRALIARAFTSPALLAARVENERLRAENEALKAQAVQLKKEKVRAYFQGRNERRA